VSTYLPFYRSAARRLGLTAPQLNAIELLAWSPDAEVPIGNIGLPRASVAKLERLGLVETTPKGYASLTPKGLDAKREGERLARIEHQIAELRRRAS
jgi:hypothetical protein